MVKARWSMQCNCGCRSEISVGSRYVLYASRPWKVDHLIAYRARRRAGRTP